MKRCLSLVFIALYGLVGITAASAQTDNSNLEEEIQDLKARITDLEAEMKASKLTEEGTFRAYWKDGLRFDSADGDFKLKIGGRIQLDSAWWLDEDDELEDYLAGLPANKGRGALLDGVEFRRARLYISGEIYEHFVFKAQYDFAGGDADFKDVYLGVQHVPFFGTILAGHQKEPFGLETLTSSKYITFLERSLPTVFTPERNTGIAFWSHTLDERMTYAFGAFKDTDDFGKDVGGDGNYTARITGLPWYEEEGAKLLHLGAGYSYRQPDDDTLSYNARTDHNGPRWIDLGEVDVDDLHKLGFESALVLGRFSVQGEYILDDVNVIGGEDATLDGWYVQGSYFLTGEHRRYKTSRGVFDRVKPRRNFWNREGGLGAWEIAARFSTVDLVDGSVDADEIDEYRAGVNWYLNPNMRVMLNYLYAHLDKIDEGASAIQVRFGVNF